MFHRETKVYNGEVSLFLLFSFSRKINERRKRRKLWKFCFTWKSEKDEIQLTIRARALGVGGVCSWYGRRNTFIIMLCIGGAVSTARAILEFLKYWFHYYYYYQHTTMVSFIVSVWKHSSTFGKHNLWEKEKEGFRYCAEFKTRTRLLS